MACFEHISHELQVIYRDLTKSSKHPLGGNAYLSLDDTEVHRSRALAVEWGFFKKAPLALAQAGTITRAPFEQVKYLLS